MSGLQVKMYICGPGDKYNPNYIFIPINPPEIKTSANGRVERIDILGLGEALLVKDRELMSWTWESYFPMNSKEANVVSMIDNYKADPDTSINALKNWEGKMACLLINKTKSNGTSVPYVNIGVMIDKLAIIDRGGDVGDIHYQITMTEYRPPKIVKTEIVKTITTQTITTNSNGQTQTTKETKVQTTDVPKREETQDIVPGAMVKCTGMVWLPDLFGLMQFIPGENNESSYKVTNRTGTIEKSQEAKKINLDYANETFYKVNFQAKLWVQNVKLIDSIISFFNNSVTKVNDQKYKTYTYGYFTKEQLQPYKSLTSK